jgi:hypothetical protein
VSLQSLEKRLAQIERQPARPKPHDYPGWETPAQRGKRYADLQALGQRMLEALAEVPPTEDIKDPKERKQRYADLRALGARLLTAPESESDDDVPPTVRHR